MTSTRSSLLQGMRATLTAILLFPAHQCVATSLVQLNTAQASEFHQAITALAKQGHVTIAAEGVPLNTHLASSASAKLLRPLALDDAVTAVGDAYDYTVQRKGNVYVLRKRYTNPNDLPVITQSECERALANLELVSKPYNSYALSYHIKFLSPPGPNLRRDQVQVVYPIIDSFAASLTLEQLAAMKENKLLISSLSQRQKILARQLRLSLYIQTAMDDVAALLPKLKQVEQNAVFCKQNVNAFRSKQDVISARYMFGYTLPEQTGNKRDFHPLTHSTGSEDFNTFGLDSQTTDPDPTDPSLLPVQADSFTPETLADGITALKKYYGAAIHVDVAVAAKTISLAGVENSPPRQIMQALADVYGLSLTEAKPGDVASFTLAIPDNTSPSDLAMLPSSLRQAIPQPFVQASHLAQIVAEEQQFYDFWQTPRYSTPRDHVAPSPNVEETPDDLERAILERKRISSGNMEFKAGLEHINEVKAALPAMRDAAIRRLRSLIEPKLQTHPNGIPSSDLGEQEHDLLATIFLVEALEATGDLLTQSVPDTVIHFDQAAIGGGIQEDSQPATFNIQFHMPHPVGGLEINGGGVTIPYYKNSVEGNEK